LSGRQSAGPNEAAAAALITSVRLGGGLLADPLDEVAAEFVA
jgi:hypothetical protein